MSVFKELYSYRELFKSNIKKEIRGKYKGSFLGVLWSFINPLLMVLVYALVFPYIMKTETENYILFLICGVIPWNFFTSSLTQGVTSITNNSNLIKKVYFPRSILPISVVSSNLVNFLISCLIILAFVIFSNVSLSWVLIFIPIIVLIQYILTLGVVFILSAINVYVKDVEYIVNFCLMLLFYATPIIYSTEMFGDNIAWLFKLNPMAYLISSYRDIFYHNQIPNLLELGGLCGISLILLVLAYNIFNKLEKRFAEEI